MSTIEKAVAKLDQGEDKRPVGADGIALDAARRDTGDGLNNPTPAEALPHRDSSPNEWRPTSADPTPSTITRLHVEELRERGMLTPGAKRSQLAEEYRLIKRPLLTNIDKKGATVIDDANLIMVTSALPGEGKTFTAINLAMSIAMERDRTVLLVDGDVAKPTAAPLLGIEQTEGLTDLLASRNRTISDLLVHTDIPNLRVLPAGRIHERATELLASERMRSLMEELSTRYRDRVVIFDSAPLLLSSESSALSDMMGQIVVVVAAERTGQHAVLDALSRLSENNIVGLILNQYRPRMGNRYGSGYGYGYGLEANKANEAAE